jgi:transposase InsO family protein
VYDRGTQFTSRFWERLHETLDTQLCFSFAYHPQTDGQTKRVNQIMEDMLRACTLQYGRSWDKSLLYAEFSYNNSYQELEDCAIRDAIWTYMSNSVVLECDWRTDGFCPRQTTRS